MEFAEKYVIAAEAGAEGNKDKIVISNEAYAVGEMLHCLIKAIQRPK